jgi:hypothetical protein
MCCASNAVLCRRLVLDESGVLGEVRLFSFIECLDSNYEDFGIAMFKLCVKYCMLEYSCCG